MTDELQSSPPDLTSDPIFDPNRIHVARLLPDQIAAKWGIIATVLRRSFPPTFSGDLDSSLALIQKDCLTGAMQVWKIHTEGGSNLAMAVTQIQRDPYSNRGSILIYSMAAVDGMTMPAMRAGMETIRKFAQWMSLDYISFYTLDDRLARVVKAMYPEAQNEQFVKIPSGEAAS